MKTDAEKYLSVTLERERKLPVINGVYFVFHLTRQTENDIIYKANFACHRIMLMAPRSKINLQLSVN